MNQLIQTFFNNEITQQGLEDLQEKYPIDLKLDMTNDAVFKDARKTRTEGTNMVKAITRRRLDITGELKDYADDISAKVTGIYSVVVKPYLIEKADRQVKAEEAAKKHQELIDSEVKKIKAIYEFIDDCRGKDSDHIQGIIEAVDLIETDIFHKDVIHEAIEAKKATLHDLTQLLSDTISREKTEKEREVLREQQAKADEKQRQTEAAQKITDRIADLKMIPTQFFDQSSKQIQYKINALENFEITEKDFSDKVEEVIQAKVVVIDQLAKMLKSQLRDEAAEREEAEKLKEEEKKAQCEKLNVYQSPELQEQIKAKNKSMMESGQETEDVMQEDPEAIEQPQEEVKQVSLEPTIEDVRGFLDWAINDSDTLDDFYSLLVLRECKASDQAMDMINTKFDNYLND